MRTLRLMRLDAWRAAPPSHPDPLRAWLTDRGSLTARIMAHFSQFNLLRVAQKFQRPTRDERRELALREGELAVVREVILRDGDTPLIFAHSVVARRDLRGAWRGLSRLGQRPLAEVLFHDPNVTRLPMEYKKIDARHALYRRAKQVAVVDANALWARRSVFWKRGRLLLVTEVFLIKPQY